MQFQEGGVTWKEPTTWTSTMAEARAMTPRGFVSEKRMLSCVCAVTELLLLISTGTDRQLQTMAIRVPKLQSSNDDAHVRPPAFQLESRCF